jgi:protein involved in polysaccharide export with SLBB domain
VRKPSPEKLAEFTGAQTAGPTVDMDRVLLAEVAAGPYQTQIGDILQLEMPGIVDGQPSEGKAADDKDRYACRIGDDGVIILPLIGPFPAAGKTLAQLEAGIMACYCPKYMKTPFPIYVSVHEYKTRRVSIVGAVTKPGVYALRPDQMSLVSLLMEAGGIVDRGAAVIRIARRGDAISAPPGTQVPAASPEPSGQTVRTDAAMQAGSPGGLDRSGTAFHVTFGREGPLATTGWLAVENGGGIRIRKWLDLASESQQAMFLRTVAAASGRMPIADLQGRLARLSVLLEFLPRGQEMRAATESSGWKVTNEGRFEASLRASPAEDGASGLVVPAKATGLVRGVARRTGIENVTSLVLPVKGLNIPFADVPLQEGDTVTVEWPREQFISVLGLVRNPGNFPYPTGAQYSLVQAIGFAGGLDVVADPRYVSIYRLNPDGEISSVVVQLVNPKKKPDLTEAMALPLRPGDVVSVEHTPRTRANVFFDRIFRINLGLYFSPESFWNNNE